MWRESPHHPGSDRNRESARPHNDQESPDGMAMGPRDHRIAQPIGMLKRDPEDCSNTSDSCSGYKRYCHDAQQATTFVCRSPEVVLCGAHVPY
jgi:hypothetical protein